MKTYLITAANRGIGLEFARQLTEAGESVIATARPGADIADLKMLDVRVERLDVSETKSAHSLAQTLESEPIDVLINNAGYYEKRSEFEELDADTVLDSFSINSLGAMRVTQALLPNLRLGNAKKIVQVTSKMGSVNDNTSGGSYAYRMSKAALNMFNKSLAIDLAGEGFSCIVVHPGWVQTRMGGSGAGIDAKESVAGLRNIISELQTADSGTFFDYSGEQIPY